MNIEPNGRVHYDVELIGTVEEQAVSSRSSVKSGSSLSFLRILIVGQIELSKPYEISI